MKCEFDDCDFRGADLRKAKMNISNWRNCRFDDADLRGIRGRHAIWEGSTWYLAKMDEDLVRKLDKKWGRNGDLTPPR